MSKPLNYQSGSTIIAKVLRDLGKQNTDFIYDAVEWIGEALDAIGSFALTESKIEIDKSHSHRLEFPCGAVAINNIYYTKQEIPEGETPTREDFDRVLPYGSPDKHPSLVEEDSEHPVKVDRIAWDESYIISGKYIRTSFESDWIMISYEGIQTDEEGFPLVPDGYEFSQALYWYIVYKMMEGGMKHPAGINYLHAEERWQKYCQMARNDANMPTYADMRKFQDSWVSLLPPKAFESYADPNGAVDANNLVVDTLKRYTVSG